MLNQSKKAGVFSRLLNYSLLPLAVHCFVLLVVLRSSAKSMGETIGL